jgi:hypothetical protein
LIVPLEQLRETATETADARGDAAVIAMALKSSNLQPCCFSGQKFSVPLIGFRNFFKLKKRHFIEQ